MSAASAVLQEEELELKIETFTLVPSDGGKFEFIANGDLIYSKLETGRHVEEGELNKVLKEYLAGK